MIEKRTLIRESGRISILIGLGMAAKVMVDFVTQLLFACHNMLAPKSSCEFEKPDSEDAIDYFHVVAWCLAFEKVQAHEVNIVCKLLDS